MPNPVQQLIKEHKLDLILSEELITHLNQNSTDSKNKWSSLNSDQQKQLLEFLQILKQAKYSISRDYNFSISIAEFIRITARLARKGTINPIEYVFWAKQYDIALELLSQSLSCNSRSEDQAKNSGGGGQAKPQSSTSASPLLSIELTDYYVAKLVKEFKLNPKITSMEDLKKDATFSLLVTNEECRYQYFHSFYPTLIADKFDSRGRVKCPLIIWAAASANPAYLQSCIQAGLIVNQQDQFKRTAAHWAYARGNTENVACLFKAGANFTIKDVRWRTPIDLGLENPENPSNTLIAILQKLIQTKPQCKLTDFIHQTNIDCLIEKFNRVKNINQTITQHELFTLLKHPDLVEAIKTCEASQNTRSLLSSLLLENETIATRLAKRLVEDSHIDRSKRSALQLEALFGNKQAVFLLIKTGTHTVSALYRAANEALRMHHCELALDIIEITTQHFAPAQKSTCYGDGGGSDEEKSRKAAPSNDKNMSSLSKALGTDNQIKLKQHLLKIILQLNTAIDKTDNRFKIFRTSNVTEKIKSDHEGYFLFLLQHPQQMRVLRLIDKAFCPSLKLIFLEMQFFLKNTSHTQNEALTQQAIFINSLLHRLLGTRSIELDINRLAEEIIKTHKLDSKCIFPSRENNWERSQSEIILNKLVEHFQTQQEEIEKNPDPRSTTFSRL